MIIKIIDNGKEMEASLPSSFAEMNETQFVAAARYCYGTIDEQTLLHTLLGKKFKHVNFFQWMMLDLRDKLTFIHELKEPVNKFFIPELFARIWSKRYYAPKDNLEGVSFLQFMSIDNFFSFYCHSQDEEQLYKMCASIYLKRDTTFVSKEKKQKLIDLAEATDFFRAYVTKGVIFAIFCNWILIKNWLTKTFPYLFVSGSNEEPGVRPKKVADWLTIFDTFVGDNIPDMESYQAMECMDAFRILNNKIKNSIKK